jgi:hypothetical protein
MTIEMKLDLLEPPPGDQSLGVPIQDDSFFRIVFLDSYMSIAPQQIQDARIALCLPPKSEHQRERVLEQERRVLRKVRAGYAVPEMELALQEAQRQIYATGTVVTHAGANLRTS